MAGSFSRSMTTGIHVCITVAWCAICVGLHFTELAEKFVGYCDCDTEAD